MKSKYEIPVSVNPVVAFGVHDSNIRLIERLLNVKIYPEEFDVVIDGEEEPVMTASLVLQSLYQLAKGNTPISHEEVRIIVEEKNKFGSLSINKIGMEGIVVSKKGHKIKTKTANQAQYIRDMMDKDLVFSIGPAGTGKTYLAIAVALNCLLTKRVDRIILSRPVVEAGENLGFLPGTLEEKINPYLKPLFDAIAEMLSSEELAYLIEKQIIELAPLGR